MAKVFNLSSIQFIKRVTVGHKAPDTNYDENEIIKAQEYINRCLSESTKGYIIGIEKNFNIINLGEHQVVMQWLVYHIGFEKKPFWME